MDFDKYENKKEFPRSLKSPFYREMVQAYREEEARLRNLFKADLEKEFGVQRNRRKDILFARAWDLGHSGGYHDVYGYYAELAELIK